VQQHHRDNEREDPRNCQRCECNATIIAVVVGDRTRECLAPVAETSRGSASPKSSTGSSTSARQAEDDRERRRAGQAHLIERIREIAATRVRYGYRRIHVLFRWEGGASTRSGSAGKIGFPKAIRVDQSTEFVSRDRRGL
jgi:hypothetical protein